MTLLIFKMVNGNDMIEHIEGCEDCIAISIIIDNLTDRTEDKIKLENAKEILGILQYECFQESFTGGY